MEYQDELRSRVYEAETPVQSFVSIRAINHDAIGLARRVNARVGNQEKPVALVPVFANRGVEAAFMIMQESRLFDHVDLFTLSQVAVIATSTDNNISRYRRKALSIAASNDTLLTFTPVDNVDPLSATVTQGPGLITQHPVFVDLLQGESSVLFRVVEAINAQAREAEVIIPEAGDRRVLSRRDIEILAQDPLIVPIDRGQAAGWQIYMNLFQQTLDEAGTGREDFLLVPFAIIRPRGYEDLRGRIEGVLEGRKPRQNLTRAYEEFLDIAGGIIDFANRTVIALNGAYHEIVALTGHWIAEETSFPLKEQLLLLQTGLGTELRMHNGRTEPIFEAALALASGMLPDDDRLRQYFLEHLVFVGLMNAMQDEVPFFDDTHMQIMLKGTLDDRIGDQTFPDVLTNAALRKNMPGGGMDEITVAELVDAATTTVFVNPTSPQPGQRSGGKKRGRRRRK